MKIIAVSGVARSGKDTVANGLASVLKDMNPSIKVLRASFADELKREMSEFLVEKFNIDPFNCEGSDKELIRPLLVGYGQARRIQSQGQYWVNIVDKKIEAEQPDVVIISDLRFAELEVDELSWLKRKGGKLIHVSRYHLNGNKKEYVKPPNSDEKKNDPILKKSADFLVDWKDSKNDEDLKKMAKEICEDFYYKNISFIQ